MASERMKPDARERWLLSRIAEEPGGLVDVCNRDFVDDYIEATGASFRAVNYGAHKCPQLGRDLSRMASRRDLRRRRFGIEGMTGLGFPRWVWSYSVRYNPYAAADEQVSADGALGRQSTSGAVTQQILPSTSSTHKGEG